MKAHSAILLVLLCVAGALSPLPTLLAQQPAADSLRRLILPSADDTLKVRRLTALAKTLTETSKYDSALATAQWATTLAERLKDEKGAGGCVVSNRQSMVFPKQIPASDGILPAITFSCGAYWL